jgi:hypothetical protein
MSSLPLGNSTDIMGFSPADFGDAEDIRPLQVQMDLTGTGTLVPYSQLLNNVLQRQTTEIKEKTVTPSPTPANWKRRFREFMNVKNEEIVNNCKKSIGSQSALSRTEVFVQKFGRADFNPVHPSLQYTFLDASGSSGISKIEEELKTIGPSSSKEILDQVRWLYDAYRVAGEECIKHENTLKLQLDVLDKTYQKVLGFCELPVNEHTEKVSEAIEIFMKKIFEEQKIEEDYKKTVEAYRRFSALREMIQFLRFTDLTEKEPLCSICLTESVTFVLVPCGHTLCGTCMKKQVHTCYMCRTTIRDRVKIYFG